MCETSERELIHHSKEMSVEDMLDEVFVILREIEYNSDDCEKVIDLVEKAMFYIEIAQINNLKNN